MKRLERHYFSDSQNNVPGHYTYERDGIHYSLRDAADLDC
jgi:hypothetical protein